MKNSSGKDTAGPPSAQEHDKQSSFNWLWCRIAFTNEPLWFRLVLITIALAATVTVIYFMREWAIFAALGKKIVPLLTAIIGKNRLH